ncbi:ferredoxin [Bacillus sp. AFS076308]|uniref:ferredoxin n=1 Tax=unclassified Bacillus (in: firmicutes) TaxID=185979 RepID=UPI000BF66958|nr:MULTISPECIES: ferredoxin [unclassified Bacillus (in: firmicutes)]PFN74868.1 ferredoxin [Bacillus sp. AFS076308]PGV50893.1 ferredoxin [Bacillus sp. AFS037270]
MKKFTIVDRETCIACGACFVTAPEVFDYDDNGISFVYFDKNQGNVEIPGELVDDVLEANDGCPSGSIKVSNMPFNGNPTKFE